MRTTIDNEAADRAAFFAQRKADRAKEPTFGGASMPMFKHVFKSLLLAWKQARCRHAFLYSPAGRRHVCRSCNVCGWTQHARYSKDADGDPVEHYGYPGDRWQFVLRYAPTPAPTEKE